MSDVLDPRLLEMVERLATGVADGATPVEVMVGLAAALDDPQRRELAARGLSIRSEIGDVLTGVIKLEDVGALAALPGVRRIEASSPVYPEAPGKKRQLPTD